jgi:hypothetical protein
MRMIMLFTRRQLKGSLRSKRGVGAFYSRSYAKVIRHVERDKENQYGIFLLLE